LCAEADNHHEPEEKHDESNEPDPRLSVAATSHTNIPGIDHPDDVATQAKKHSSKVAFDDKTLGTVNQFKNSCLYSLC